MQRQSLCYLHSSLLTLHSVRRCMAMKTTKQIRIRDVLVGDGVGLIFRRGEIIKKVPQEQLVDALMDEIAQYEGE